MRFYPAVHYTMGGLWVDYNLMSNIPGLHVLGEANFSDHGANRLGASALMQGLADGYFVIPSTIANYLATQMGKKVSTDQPEFKAVEDEVRTRTNRLLSIKGKKTVTTFHRDLGLLVWDKCGMARDAQGLQEALQKIPAIARGVLGKCARLGASQSLIRRSSTRAELRIFWNSPNSCAWTPWNETNRVAAISELSARQRKAKRCETTIITATSLHGSTLARTHGRILLRSRSGSIM